MRVRLAVPRFWRAATRYAAAMTPEAARRVVQPLPRPKGLDQYEGLWVAVLDGDVVAAEETSHALALKIHAMDHRRRREISVEFVRPRSDSYIVGVG
jgi:hypothetical protein